MEGELGNAALPDASEGENHPPLELTVRFEAIVIASRALAQQPVEQQEVRPQQLALHTCERSGCIVRQRCEQGHGAES